MVFSTEYLPKLCKKKDYTSHNEHNKALSLLFPVRITC